VIEMFRLVETTSLVALLVAGVACQEQPSRPPLVGASGCSRSASTPGELEALAHEGVLEEEDALCSLTIRQTTLRSLDAVAGLKRIGGVTIADNPELVDIDALSTLDELAGIDVSGTPLAGEITLPAAMRGLELDLSAAPATSVVSDATTLGEVAIEGLALESISFPLATTIDTLSIGASPALTHLDFPSLTSLRRLRVHGADGIAQREIDALAALVEDPENVVID
jgi:hypothetical protein